MTKPFTVWFTGLPGSGKTTLAKMLTVHLQKNGVSAALLDGPDIRQRTRGLLGFSQSARRIHAIYCAVAASILNDAGVHAAAALMSPSRKDRQDVRELIGPRFFEIYVGCDPEVAKARMPNPAWTGIRIPYEEPEAPDLRLDTTKDDPEESLMLVLLMLKERAG